MIEKNIIRTALMHTATVVTALLLFTAGGVMPAYAYDALIIESGDLKPYHDVIRGFTDACNCDVEEMTTKEGDGKKLIYPQSPSVVLVVGTSAFRKVKEITTQSLVYTMVMPSETNAIKNRNIAGVSMDISPAVFLAHIAELFPSAKRVGVLYDPRNTASYVEEAKKTAHDRGIELAVRQVRDAAEVPRTLDELGDTIDVLWMLPDPTIASLGTVEVLLRFSFRKSVPVFSFSRKYVEMGAVASLDSDPYDMGVQAAEIAGSISQGAADVLCVYARKARLTINEKVAAKMGIRFKEEVRRRASNAE